MSKTWLVTNERISAKKSVALNGIQSATNIHNKYARNLEYSRF